MCFLTTTKMQKTKCKIIVMAIPAYLINSLASHLSLTSNFSDTSAITTIAPNAEHSQVVFMESVSFTTQGAGSQAPVIEYSSFQTAHCRTSIPSRTILVCQSNPRLRTIRALPGSL